MSRWLAMSLCLGLLTGCGNRLIPPASPVDPVEVHILDHGRHPSLVLPDDQGGWIRYVYGEWRWYAEDQTGVWRGIQAMLWSTQAALGRRSLDSLPQPGQSAAIPEGFVTLYSFDVAKRRAEALRHRLNAHFDLSGQQIYQPRYNVYFVRYPANYWVFQQSNQMMKQWLEALDVDVQGAGLISDWQLQN